MSGRIDGFVPAEFREAISFVMTMGQAPIEADRPVFVFPVEITNTAPADVEGVPFDPSARAVTALPQTAQVPCAIEYVDAQGRVESTFTINPSKVRITLFDEDYEKVRGFEYVELGGDRYNYAKTEPPLGLGEVGVWTVHCIAEDES